ncbi:MAG: tyrosine-type recombinase/integrase [Christensenellaceae bacterium]|jgi:integrase/recombinase XerC
MAEQTHHEEVNKKMTVKLREVRKELPPFTNSFFSAFENTTTILTRFNYAIDLRIFFQFLTSETPYFSGKKILDISADDLKEITIDDLYLFLDYLSLYARPSHQDDDASSGGGQEQFLENHAHGKARKVACLRSFFKHYYKKGILKENICQLLDTPKINEKPIVRLEPNEVAALLDIVENGENLTNRQKQFHKKNVLRDMAIFILFLTTGIRVSELVAINISDIDFNANSFRITRKGGNQVLLYFDTETEAALQNYLEERKTQGTYALASPLFLSMQGKRISVRAVENLVKKYTRLAAPLKKISPHKLRSTYGTMLYQETGDIYLVADVLGHKDVNTTKKHYAAMSEENRKRASKAVKLRE